MNKYLLKSVITCIPFTITMTRCLFCWFCFASSDIIFI